MENIVNGQCATCGHEEGGHYEKCPDHGASRKGSRTGEKRKNPVVVDPTCAASLPKQAGTPVDDLGAGTFLKKAAAIVEGSRQKTHGDKERSFEAIALMWEAYLTARKHGKAQRIRAQDVPAMMNLLKYARSEHGNPGEPDHGIDVCGYAGLWAELSNKEVLRQEREEQAAADHAQHQSQVSS